MCDQAQSQWNERAGRHITIGAAVSLEPKRASRAAWKPSKLHEGRSLGTRTMRGTVNAQSAFRNGLDQPEAHDSVLCTAEAGRHVIAEMRANGLRPSNSGLGA